MRSSRPEAGQHDRSPRVARAAAGSWRPTKGAWKSGNSTCCQAEPASQERRWRLPTPPPAMRPQRQARHSPARRPPPGRAHRTAASSLTCARVRLRGAGLDALVYKPPIQSATPPSLRIEAASVPRCSMGAAPARHAAQLAGGRQGRVLQAFTESMCCRACTNAASQQWRWRLPTPPSALRHQRNRSRAPLAAPPPGWAPREAAGGLTWSCRNGKSGVLEGRAGSHYHSRPEKTSGSSCRPRGRVQRCSPERGVPATCSRQVQQAGGPGRLRVLSSPEELGVSLVLPQPHSPISPSSRGQLGKPRPPGMAVAASAPRGLAGSGGHPGRKAAGAGDMRQHGNGCPSRLPSPEEPPKSSLRPRHNPPWQRWAWGRTRRPSVCGSAASPRDTRDPPLPAEHRYTRAALPPSLSKLNPLPAAEPWEPRTRQVGGQPSTRPGRRTSAAHEARRGQGAAGLFAHPPPPPPRT